ncbi:restriction endonuclease subunit S [Prevotella bivia]|uniref:restriction endonuclease subunit S n=1 Tax=Prevotella bivia TaxID=28125 RepID=UPI002550D67F|nr:restriction endonuclease subunit S [Prevotella bivia]MDZ3818489.1 restriction endonuclease subunit S [Prevotella bivia]
MDTKKLRQKILDLAIHGKLVPQDPNDEPASVLLERIRAEKERLIKEGKIKRSRKTAKTSDTPHYPQDVPFEVPEGWAWTTVNNISKSIIYGVSESAKSEGKYKLLRITDIQNNKVDWETVPFTDFDDDKVASYILYDGDIVFARTGATVGKSYLIKGLSQKAIYASYLIRVQTFDLILPEYVKLFFESGYYWEQIELTSVGIGQPNVNGTILGSLNIPLPPFAEQKRIVIEKDRWLSLLEQIEQGKANLQIAIKQTKSKILDLAIHGKLVPQDPNDEPASELLKRINPKAQITCDNEHYPHLPKGWTVTSMQEVCSLLDGEKQNNRSLINLDVKFLRGNSKGIAINAGKYVPANTYMILVDGENSGEVFKALIDGYQGSTFKQLSINENMNEKFVLHIINLHGKALRENKVGSAIPHLNKKLFKAIPVPIPPYAEQERIVVAINAAYALLTVIEESL